MNIKNKGFTLIELMIAVAVVAILAAIAMPSYQGYVQRSARANVQSDLMTAASRMERLKAQNFTYKGGVAGTTFSATSPSDAPAGNEKYTITLILLKNDRTVADPATDVVGGYEIQAVSTAKFDSSRTEALKINDLGQKCIQPLAASVTTCTIGTDAPW